MLICELLPLKTTKKLLSLTYFTNLNINIGDLVEINMNGQILKALIINTKNIKDAKQEIRSSDFKIKKINKILKEKYISENLLSELYNLSTLLCTSINNIFNTLAPIEILSQISFEKRKNEKLNQEETINNYKSKRENKINLDNKAEPKHEHNTFNIFPTKLELRKFKKENKNQKDFCSTPSFLFLTKNNINKIIIHNESSKYYYSFFKNVDTKRALSYICDILNIEIEYEFDTPSLELYYKLRSNIYKNKKQKIDEISKTNVNILSMKESKNLYLHESLLSLLQKQIKENQKVLLYTARLGLNTRLICQDCSQEVNCQKCNKPYILYKEKDSENNYLKCKTCKDKIFITEEIRCANCNGFNIKPLGIGTQGLEEYIKNNFYRKSGKENKSQKSEGQKEIKIYRIDSENTKTPAQIEKVFEEFKKGDRESREIKIESSKKVSQQRLDILIATEQIINILENNTFDSIIIVSIDNMFYISDYNIDERIFFIISKLKSSLKIIATENSSKINLPQIFLQTRMSEKFIEKSIKKTVSQNYQNFYDDELKKREKNSLPPYFYIITFEAPESFKIPKFLTDFENIKIPISINSTFSINNYNENHCKFIFFIQREIWEKEKVLRSLCFENLFQFNLKINSKELE